MRSIPWFGVGLFVVFACPLGQANADKTETIALWKLTGLGVSNREVVVVRQALAAAFRQNLDWTWIDRRAVRDRLNRAGVTQTSSAEEAVRALQVRYVLVGMLASLGDQSSFDIKLLDGNTAAEVRRVSITLPSGRSGLGPVFDELVVRLMKPEDWVGGIALEVTVADAEIWLDGELIDRSPLHHPLLGLNPGKHALTIRKEGYEEFSEFVQVQYDKLTREKVDLRDGSIERSLLELNPQPSVKPTAQATSEKAVEVSQPPASGWKRVTAWSCLGGALALGVAAGLVGWSLEDVNQRVEDGRWDQSNESDLKEILDTGEQRAGLANGLLIAGSLSAVASIILFVWDSGSGEAGESGSIAVSADGRSLGISGRF